jgi:tyrosinase
MAVVRGNILTTPHGQTFLDGVVALSQLTAEVTPARLNQAVPANAQRARIFGTATEMNRPLSWWDLLCWWHQLAMSTPAGSGNRAHRGPIFLPWHRMYLRRLEEAIQAVTGDDDFALPYWDWAADGGLNAEAQDDAPVWSRIGPARGTITQGPVGQLRARLYFSVDDQRLYVMAPRAIWREAQRGVPTLPDGNDQARTLADPVYDAPEWREQRTDSFRNKVEGFQDPTEPPPTARRVGPWMHNRIHVWVGGDMGPGTSPNDPVFWLNHCNVDRLWEAWMRRHGRTYLPGPGQGPTGHRADDDMVSIVWPSLRPADVLDPTESGLDWYRYDQLPG